MYSWAHEKKAIRSSLPPEYRRPLSCACKNITYTST